jgi:hypothetical protein
MTRRRLIAGLAIPVALAVAIVLVLVTSRDPESPPTTPAAAPTTAPPTTQPAQDEWLTIVRQIVEERHAIYQNPQPELLSQIYDRNGPAYPKEYQTIVGLRQQGLHYRDQGVEIRDAKLIGKAQGTTGVAIEVTSREFPKALINADGKVIRTEPATPPAKVVYNLIKGSDQRWRIYVVYKPSG